MGVTISPGWIVTQSVTTMTVPTPVRPILTHLHHFRVIRTIPEHPLPTLNPLAPSQVSLHLNNTLLNPLAPSWANLHLSNALLNPLTPLHLVNAFPTQHPIDLPFLTSSQFLTPTLIPKPTLFNLLSFLRQVHSQCFHWSHNCSGRSPIAYLPRWIRPSLFFLTLYISVSLLSTVRSSVISFATLHSFFMPHPQFPVSVYPLFIYLYSLPPLTLL